MFKVQKGDLWLSAILFLIVLTAYFPAMRGGFSLNDDVLITDNADVNSPDGLNRIWQGQGVPDYYPLTYSLFWIEWRMWHLQASGYHVVNVLLHLIGVLLLWRILVRLRVPGAWAAALIFSVHPVSAGTVAWISEGKNTLSLVFYMLAIFLFLNDESPTADPNPAAPPALSTSRYYWLSLLAFACALLSKASVVMLPFALLGCVWWLQRKIMARDFRRIAPFFLLSFVFGLITLWFQKYRAGTVTLDNALDFPSRFAVAGRAIWFYFFKAVLPIHLSFFYPESKIDASSVTSYLPHAALLIVIGVLWKFRQTFGRAGIFGVGYFVLTLLPVLGFFDMYFFIYSRVADHFQYLALPGIVALFVGCIWTLTSKPESKPGFSTPCWITLGIVVLLVCSTRQRSRILGDVEAMWRDTLQKNPSSWGAHGNLAGVLRDKQKPDEAIPEYLKALELNPKFANAHFELAELLAMRGNIPEATFHFGEVAQLKPKSADAHFNYGVGLEKLGKTEQALAQYQETLNINPGHLLCQNAAGSLCTRLKQFAPAEDHFKAALQIKPDFALSHFNYGDLLSQQGRLNDAVAQFSEAIRLDPAQLDPYVGLADVLGRLGQKNEAVTLLKRAIELKPDYEEAKAKLKELTAPN